VPKATLEFNLPEEREEYNLCVNGSNYSSALWKFNEYLRNVLKHNPKDLSDEQLNLVEEIQKEFFESLDTYDVVL
jgi:uncharacterized UPF0160 family protein